MPNEPRVAWGERRLLPENALQARARCRAATRMHRFLPPEVEATSACRPLQFTFWLAMDYLDTKRGEYPCPVTAPTNCSLILHRLRPSSSRLRDKSLGRSARVQANQATLLSYHVLSLGPAHQVATLAVELWLLTRHAGQYAAPLSGERDRLSSVSATLRVANHRTHSLRL